MMGKRWVTKSLDTCLDKVYLDIILSVQMVKAMLLLNGTSHSACEPLVSEKFCLSF